MKRLVIVAMGIFCLCKNSSAQKIKKDCTNRKSFCAVIEPCVKDFEMDYPVNMQEAIISSHFGRNNIGMLYYQNEMVTFSTKINATVHSNVDSVIVKSIVKLDDVFCVFLAKKDYIIVFFNLQSCKVKEGQCLQSGTVVGTLAADEEDRSKGLLELMLFKNNKMLNPEKFLKEKTNEKSMAVNLSNV